MFSYPGNNLRKNYVKNTRSSIDHYLLCRPPLSKGCCNTFLERSYPFSATRELSIKHVNENIRKSDFNMFKESVKTDLFVQCHEC